MKDSRGKGAKFMRSICTVFTRWIDPIGVGLGPDNPRQEDLAFRVRSTSIQPIEGHWYGRGDILCRPDIPWPFTTECKKVEGWEMDGMLANEAWPVWRWWDQTTQQALADGGVPLLVFARNRRDNCILIEEAAAKCLRLKPRNGPLARVERPNGEVLVLALLDDLVRVPVANLRKLYRSSLGKKSSPRSRMRSVRTTRSRTS